MRDGKSFDVTRCLFFALTMSAIGLGSGCGDSLATVPQDAREKDRVVQDVRKESMSKKGATRPQQKPGMRPIMKR